MTDRIFISHASKDAAIAEHIVAYLESRGLACWISSRDIPPRAIYADAIVEGMQACTACAVLVSAASNASKAVKRELELATRQDKPFIPIKIDGAEPASGLAFYLQSSQWLDYSREGERALDRMFAQTPPLAPQTRATSSPPPAASQPSRALIAILAAVVIGIGAIPAIGWFNGINADRERQDELIQDYLVGDYFWGDQACGDGPRVSYQGGSLIFQSSNAPTYVHDVEAFAATGEDGENLRLRTRVREPRSDAGQQYTIENSAETGTLTLQEQGATHTWNRCMRAYQCTQYGHFHAVIARGESAAVDRAYGAYRDAGFTPPPGCLWNTGTESGVHEGRFLGFDTYQDALTYCTTLRRAGISCNVSR